MRFAPRVLIEATRFSDAIQFQAYFGSRKVGDGYCVHHNPRDLQRRIAKRHSLTRKDWKDHDYT